MADLLLAGLVAMLIAGTLGGLAVYAFYEWVEPWYWDWRDGEPAEEERNG